ncbi:hypothetical protein PInf_009186 [Phytophthora infestans]|nr:hypothetical protein PInf_009186 [Phytophthora infestans]
MVTATMEWIDKVEFQVDSIVEPFKDSVDITKQCFLFDPMQLKSNISSLRTAVCAAVEPMLKMTDQIQYETITGCEQQDSSSCCLWCLVVLELLLFGATHDKWSNYWSDSLYEAVGYLRMRYLHKVIKLQSHFPVEDEPEEEK